MTQTGIRRCPDLPHRKGGPILVINAHWEKHCQAPLVVCQAPVPDHSLANFARGLSQLSAGLCLVGAGAGG